MSQEISLKQIHTVDPSAFDRVVITDDVHGFALDVYDVGALRTGQPKGSHTIASSRTLTIRLPNAMDPGAQASLKAALLRMFPVEEAWRI